MSVFWGLAGIGLVSAWSRVEIEGPAEIKALGFGEGLRTFEAGLGGAAHLELGGYSFVFSFEGGRVAVLVVGLADHLVRLPDLVLFRYPQSIHLSFRGFQNLYTVLQLIFHSLN
jgi:hypothetical protein